MRKVLFVLMLCIGSGLCIGAVFAGAKPHTYHICDHKYALCTSAKCIPTPNDPRNTSICQCQVFTGPSLGFSSCEKREPLQVQGVRQVISTFSFKQYKQKKLMHCPKEAQWSDCLDQKCIVDPSDPKKAICQCKIKRDEASITLGGGCNPATCDTGFWSGATPAAAKILTPALASYLKIPTPGKTSFCEKQR